MDDTQKLLSALSYPLWPVAVIVLIIQETKQPKQQDKTVRRHAYNALGFAVAALIGSIIVFILSWIFMLMWLGVLGYVISTLFWITVLVLAILYAIRAYNNEEVIIPFVTDFLKKNVKGF